MNKPQSQAKHQKIQQSDIQQSNSLIETNPPQKISTSYQEEGRLSSTPKARLQSLDYYRGFTLFGMLLVDHVGGISGCFYWLTHVSWNGFTTASLVLPSFLFIMGIAIPFSIKETRPLQKKNIKRIIYLFLIGAVFNLISQSFYIKGWRIPGVLQTLSLCYGIVLFIHWITEYGNNRGKKIIAGVTMVGLVVAHTLGMLLWQDPQNGCFKPSLSPTCNFSRFVDLAIFTEEHMLGPTDPSGVVQYMTQSFTTYCGYLFGLMLIKFKDQEENFIKFGFTFALFFGVLAYPFSLIIPINKSLYTVSFLFVVLAFSGATFTIFFFVFDYIPRKTQRKLDSLKKYVQPLLWLGMNSLVIYLTFLSVCIVVISFIHVDGKYLHTYLYELMFSSWIIPQFGSILYGFIYIFFYIMVARRLYMKKIFVSL